MEYRNLGATGLKVSAVSIGAWLTYGSSAVEFETAKECLRVAVDNGINFIDVADVYARGEAEKTVGKIVKEYDRSKLVISTKAYWGMSEDVNDRGLSRKHVIESVHKSLKRFEMDYIDIFFCHRYDSESPTEETVRAIEDLIRDGKILYWGTSMWNAQNLQEAVDIADKTNGYRPVTEQPLYNILDRDVVEGDLEPKLAEYGIGLVVWSPLAGGLLTGKYDNGMPEGSRGATSDAPWIIEQFSEARIEKARKITQIAREHGITPAALALAWAMAHPHVDSVITGATKPQQVLDNIKALEVSITPELEAQIDEAVGTRPSNSHRTVS